MGLVGAYDLGYYWNYQKLATCSPRPLGQTGQYVGRNKRAQTGTVRREQQP